MAGRRDEHQKAIRSTGHPVDSLPTFLEIPGFWDRWREFGLTDDDLHLLQLTLAARPEIGDVVPGTNGVRKMRFAAPGSGKGKSGSARVFYLNTAFGVVVLGDVLAKSESSNLSKAERNDLAAAVARIKADLQQRSKR